MHPYIAYLVLTSPTRGIVRPDETGQPLQFIRRFRRMLDRLRAGTGPGR